jgi:hypothetical protein
LKFSGGPWVGRKGGSVARRKSVKTVPAEAPDGSVTVSVVFMDDGAIGLRFSAGPWMVETAFIGAAHDEEMTFVRRQRGTGLPQ